MELLLELISHSEFGSEKSFKNELENQLISLGPRVCTSPDLSLLLFTAKKLNILTQKEFKVIWVSHIIMSHKL